MGRLLRPKIKSAVTCGVALATMLVGAGSTESATAATTAKGTLTIIDENILWENLDPDWNTHDLLGATYMNALYGELFYQKSNGTVGMGFAKSYKFTNGNKTFSFAIRPGINFSDGTPYNAAAVAYNINRDLSRPADGGTADFFGEVKSTKAIGDTVVMQLKKPDVAVLDAFVNDTLDWIGSPTAIKKEGKTQFGIHPVGAGPFEVQNITPDSKIVMVANPHYYIKGEPKLAGLTILTTEVDQSAYSALQAGSAQLVQGITTPSIIKQAGSNFTVAQVGSQFVTNLELNTYKPPFNNPLARQAVADAINPAQIITINSPGLGKPEEGLSGPGSDFYEKTVKGYSGNNLSKAKADVAKLGGLSFTIEGGTSPAANTEFGSLESELTQAGITAKSLPMQLPEEEQRFFAGNWQAVTSSSGGADPETGSQDLQSRYESSGPYTCCKDPKLDGMISTALGIGNAKQRDAYLGKLYSYVISRHYIVPLYSAPQNVIYTKNLAGVTVAPGLEANGITLPLATMSLKSKP